MEEKPNVILLVIDCLRSDRIFGRNRTCKTPNIDKLVAQGTSLPNVFVENSITAPSFASIFTGRYAGNHGVVGMVGVQLDDEAVTMAEVFAANGYQTYAEATGPLNPILGIDKGFAHYNFRSQHDSYFSNWGKSLLEKIHQKKFNPPYFLLIHFWEAHVTVQVPPDFDKEEFGDTAYDRAISGLDNYIGRLLESVSDDTVVILTGDHGECIKEIPPPNTLLHYFLNKLNLPPVETPMKYQTINDVTDMMAKKPVLHQFVAELSVLASKDKIALWQRIKMMFELLRIGGTRYWIQIRSGIKESGGGFFANIKQKLNDIMLCIAVVRGNPDAAQFQLGRLSLREHTLQHGYHIYEYLQKVPVVFVNKRLFGAGKRVETEVRHIDLLPTLIEAMQLHSPDNGFDGTSYMPEINNNGGGNRPIYLEARGGVQAKKVLMVRGFRRDKKKIAFAPLEKNAPVEYYKLADDPFELDNKSITNPDEVNALKEEANAVAKTFRNSGKKLSAEENVEIVKRLKSLGYL